MPDYTVKNIKSFRGHEGYGFNVDLCCNGKKVAFVMDQADGAPVHIEWESSKDKEDLKNHIKDMTYTFYDVVYPMTIDIFITEIVDKVENEKKRIAQEKRWIKKETVFHLKDQKEGEYRTVKAPFCKKVKDFVVNKYDDQVEYFLNERYGQKTL